MSVSVQRIEPAPPPPVEYRIGGLDEETAIALRTLLYNVVGRGTFPGLEQLHQELQQQVGHLPAVLNVTGGSVNAIMIARRAV